jgi:3-polyprenyl-4-hydroxybenzoate decarboxylase
MPETVCLALTGASGMPYSNRLLVPRETPLSAIRLENMLPRAGAI